MDGSPLVFDVICINEEMIKSCVAFHNESYHTDFQIVGYSYDEVVFATIRVETYKPEDIFNLGYLLGATEKAWKIKHTIR
jgi:hypothetical protein